MADAIPLSANDSQRWFACPTCQYVVTSLVKMDGENNEEKISRTHCCHKCASGGGHDTYWCCGIPGSSLMSVDLPAPGDEASSCKAHCVVHLPDQTQSSQPAPALLFLHGAVTYVWPETLYQDVRGIVDNNSIAKEFVVIAPLAACGEPLAVPNESRMKNDRHGNERPYVACFNEELTWKCFIAACQQIGPGRIDFSRLCVTGLSMGGQACWNIGLKYGAHIAALAPMAGKCSWPGDTWQKAEQGDLIEQLCRLHVRHYSTDQDYTSYKWSDFTWLAQQRGLHQQFNESVLPLPPSEADLGKIRKASPDRKATFYSWRREDGEKGGDHVQLCLIHGHDDDHNCWELVYQREDWFHLFNWMTQARNARGMELETPCVSMETTDA